MKIRKLSGIDLTDHKALDEAFATLEVHHIDSCNWAEEYPYAPKADFRIFHTGSHIALRFEVEEEVTAAVETKDNGKVWEDSCGEFFIAIDEQTYYNIEVSCIGYALANYRRGRKQILAEADEKILSGLIRIPSLGTEPFAERQGDNRWTLTLLIPTTLMHQHKLESWDGVRARGNFFKGGQGLSKLHFLSWNPIPLPEPNFHCPEYFADLEFE